MAWSCQRRRQRRKGIVGESKQAVLPLWGNAANAHMACTIAQGHFGELCAQFVDADSAKDEARMSALVSNMRALVSRLDTFQRAQFRKWAREREAQRR